MTLFWSRVRFNVKLRSNLHVNNYLHVHFIREMWAGLRKGVIWSSRANRFASGQVTFYSLLHNVQRFRQVVCKLNKKSRLRTSSKGKAGIQVFLACVSPTVAMTLITLCLFADLYTLYTRLKTLVLIQLSFLLLWDCILPVQYNLCSCAISFSFLFCVQRCRDSWSCCDPRAYQDCGSITPVRIINTERI